MLTSRFRTALVVLAASAGLAGCAYGPYGGNGVSVGIGSNGYCGGLSGYGCGYGYGYGSPYGYGYGNPYGYGYLGGYPYYGWYDGFYYPGAGYYVYDPYGYPHHWTPKQESHWRDILENAKQKAGITSTAQVKENWTGFTAKAATPTTPEQQRNLETIRQRIRANQAEIRAAQRAGASVDANANASADRASLEKIREARRQARIEAQAEQRQQRIERQSVQSDSSTGGGERHRRLRKGGGE